MPQIAKEPTPRISIVILPYQCINQNNSPSNTTAKEKPVKVIANFHNADILPSGALGKIHPRRNATTASTDIPTMSRLSPACTPFIFNSSPTTEQAKPAMASVFMKDLNCGMAAILSTNSLRFLNIIRCKTIERYGYRSWGCSADRLR